MSTLETILSRAMSDAAFAEQLFAHPEKALAGYDLSAEEIEQVKNISRTDFVALAPEERKSFLIQKFEGGSIEGEVTTLP